MSIKIDDLFEVKDFEKLMAVFLDAFRTYPKLEIAFKNPHTRMAALEATIRFYSAYDLRYGKAYSLNEEVNEGVVLIESSQVHYSFLRHLLARSYAKGYRKAMGHLNKSEKQTLRHMFVELDQLETTLDLPPNHLYIDFVGVKTSLQGQGNGRKLMTHVCHYADKRQLPLMLFTNTDLDVAFYKSLGFFVAGITHSDKYGFTNTYMLRIPS